MLFGWPLVEGGPGERGQLGGGTKAAQEGQAAKPVPIQAPEAQLPRHSCGPARTQQCRLEGQVLAGFAVGGMDAQGGLCGLSSHKAVGGWAP